MPSGAGKQTQKETKPEERIEEAENKDQIKQTIKQEGDFLFPKGVQNENVSSKEEGKSISLGEEREVNVTETDEVRRRRLLLEAAERRAQQDPQTDETQENKKNQ